MVKVAIFATMLGVDYTSMATELIVLSLFLILGTIIAGKVLKRISGDRFKQIVSIVLSLIALRLLWSSGASYFALTGFQ